MAQPRPRRGKVGWLLLLALGTVFVSDTRFNPVGGVLRLVLLGLLPLIVLVSPSHGRPVRSPSSMGKALSLILVIGLSSSITSDVPILGFIKLGLFVLVIVPLAMNRSIQEALWPGTAHCRYFSLGLNVVIVLCVAQTVGAFGFLSNPNKLAAAALVALPWKLMQLSAGRRRDRWLAIGSILVLYWICVVTHSRGAMGGFLITVLVFRFTASTRSLLIPITVGAFVIVGLGIISDMNPEAREFLYKDRETLLDDRRQAMVDNTLERFRERPLLGYGFGLSWKVRPEHVDAVMRTGRISWFVGEFGSSTLAILAGGGAFLLLAFVLYFVLLLRFVEGSFRSVCSSGLACTTQRSLFAAIIGMLAYSQVEGWMLSPLNWISVFFWLYVGMAIRLASGTIVQSKRPMSGPAIEEPGALLAKAQRVAAGDAGKARIGKGEDGA